jgi:hypothetical protein
MSCSRLDSRRRRHRCCHWRGQRGLRRRCQRPLCRGRRDDRDLVAGDDRWVASCESSLPHAATNAVKPSNAAIGSARLRCRTASARTPDAARRDEGFVMFIGSALRRSLGEPYLTERIRDQKHHLQSVSSCIVRLSVASRTPSTAPLVDRPGRPLQCEAAARRRSRLSGVDDVGYKPPRRFGAPLERRLNPGNRVYKLDCRTGDAVSATDAYLRSNLDHLFGS